MDKDLLRKKNEFIEKMGMFFENKEHLSPIAAKIFAMIILSGKRGSTFEEIVADLEIGKSTASSHLDALQSSKRIEYYMIEGDRKRYFTVNSNFLTNLIQTMELEWIGRRDMFIDVLEFQKACIEEGNENEENYDLQFLKGFINNTNELINILKQLKNSIKAKHK